VLVPPQHYPEQKIKPVKVVDVRVGYEHMGQLQGLRFAQGAYIAKVKEQRLPRIQGFYIYGRISERRIYKCTVEKSIHAAIVTVSHHAAMHSTSRLPLFATARMGSDVSSLFI
jgi:hypothetical protein